ncbi:MAG TPA: NAD(P)H-hydrate dehydratase [Beijerinckiaceae bacterium]|nr:NAD(P)H-hydrate dehydratase [Beijerinckiaceae bacterium]
MKLELLTTAQTRDADARTIAAGTPGYTLMERAGAACADAAERLLAGGKRVLVVAGPGNNGGDGFVAARRLAERGLSVTVALFGDRAALRGDAAQAAADWNRPVEPLSAADPSAADVIVDALFGAGLARDLDGEARAAVERLNAAGRPVLAIDVPSGVDGDTGQVRGVAIRAAATITFVRRKPGHLLFPGRAYCGPVEVADIRISEATLRATAPTTFVNHPDLWTAGLPRPSVEGHKYGRGHALVLSGDATHTGAARLAAGAALRAGAGLVTVASPSDALPVNAAHLTAVMLRRCNAPADLIEILSDPRFNAVAMGPALGIGQTTRDLVLAACAAGPALVLDADALTSFAGDAAALGQALAAGGSRAVLTPHDGEFARLFKGEVLDPPSKLERARRAAARMGAVLVLKGPDTVIAAHDGRAAINENGSPYLATAGSGDVLTGLVAGLLAQGMPPFEAACAAVWLHAEAGARFGPGLIATDLPELLPGVLREAASRLGRDARHSS